MKNSQKPNFIHIGPVYSKPPLCLLAARKQKTFFNLKKVYLRSNDFSPHHTIPLHTITNFSIRIFLTLSKKFMFLVVYRNFSGVTTLKICTNTIPLHTITNFSIFGVFLTISNKIMFVLIYCNFSGVATLKICLNTF